MNMYKLKKGNLPKQDTLILYFKITGIKNQIYSDSFLKCFTNR